MLSYIATEAMYICYKAYLYIESLCIKAYCIAFVSVQIYSFFPTSIVLPQELFKWGWSFPYVPNRTCFEGIAFFYIHFKNIYICTHKQLRK